VSVDFPPPMPGSHDSVAHKRIDRIENEIGGVFSRINELERKVSGMVTDITWIRSTLDAQREDMEDIKRGLTKHASEFTTRADDLPTRGDFVKAIVAILTIIGGALGIPYFM